MINCKDKTVLRGVLSVGWHPLLINLYEWLLDRHESKIVLTCGYEARDYASTHSVVPLRAFDIRSWTFADPKAVVDEINAVWMYDYERPDKVIAIYHDVGRGAHIHIQVHDNTIKNGVFSA